MKITVTNQLNHQIYGTIDLDIQQTDDEWFRLYIIDNFEFEQGSIKLPKGEYSIIEAHNLETEEFRIQYPDGLEIEFLKDETICHFYFLYAKESLDASEKHRYFSVKKGTTIYISVDHPQFLFTSNNRSSLYLENKKFFFTL